MAARHPRRGLPIGAEVVEGGVHFRVWAPAAKEVQVVVEDARGGGASGHSMSREADGYFSGFASGLGAGARYRYRVNGKLLPDPASRFQPEGPHGPSEVIDPEAFRWTDGSWRGVRPEGQVIYEMHVGTFTPEGTWEAATRELEELADLGITVVEIMPLADFPGLFGWGYDGVNLYAPTRLYGRPDDFRRFVDRAHAVGVGVILDVVYNHFGPDGNYLKEFAPAYFTDRYQNDWGEAINFDGPNAKPVREFFAENAAYWVREFQLDGLRLDATQQIFDASPEHVHTAVVRKAREAAGGRAVYLVAENEPQHTHLVRPEDAGGHGLDALWNDDFHHSARVAMTGRSEAYYSDCHGTPQELLSAVKWGFLYQGQRSEWQKNPRGTSALDLPPTAFINYLQNHDQVANSADGLRCHQLTSPGRDRALTALLLLAPGTPMIFQGQEFAASTPFFYFADHKEELAGLIGEGRAKFLSQFPSITSPEVVAGLPDPSDVETFRRSKLDLGERHTHAKAYAMTRDLLRIRRDDPGLRAPRRGLLDGAVLESEAFVLRFFRPEGDRLLLVNLGRHLHLRRVAEPLLAPPTKRSWRVEWSSEDPRYGGQGTPPIVTDDGWHLPGHSAVLLASE